MDANAAEHLARLNTLVAQELSYPAEKFSGRGIVICAGGERYFTNAYVCVSILRMHGCKLPIQFWHLGPAEMTDEMRELVRPLGVECVDGYEVRKEHPARILNGWELKSFALLHCPFAEVIFLDADNVPLRDPTFLFDTPQYQQTGAIFWPDYGRLAESRAIWEITGISYRDEPEFESGQIVVDKARCWKALHIAMYFNEYSDFYYRHVHGDKETFHLAWRKLDQEYSMPSRGIHALHDTMCQHDFDGNRIFQHRNLRKWKLFGMNQPIEDFQLENECLGFLEELRKKWSVVTSREHPLAQELMRKVAEQGRYTYCRVGYDFREITFHEDGSLDAGNNAAEQAWGAAIVDGAPRVQIYQDGGVLCDLAIGGHGMLHGHWVRHEKMPVVLLPVTAPALLANTVASAPAFKPYFRPNTWDAAIWHSIVEANEYGFAESGDARRPWHGDVIDIGGHIGSFSYFAAHKLNARRIVVIEPDPENFKVLERNLAELIAAGRVVAIHAGIGPENAFVEKNGPITENTGGGVYSPAETGTIPTVTLASLLARVEGPVLLKLDCEGCEYQALEDCADVSKIAAVVGEVHVAGDKNADTLSDFFVDRGYEFSVSFQTPTLGLFGAHKWWDGK